MRRSGTGPSGTGPSATTVPDLAEPVGAWRIWRLSVAGGPSLHAPVRGTRWPARAAATAVCPARCRRPPTPACGCGLYALADLPALRRWDMDGGVVLGCTALWGRVVEATRGWRGERAYPLVLMVAPFLCEPDPALRRALGGAPDQERVAAERATVARALEVGYGVPVRPLPASLEGYFRRSGAIDPCARAVRDEAVRGLADRRLGDHDAVERLDRAVAALSGAMAR